MCSSRHVYKTVENKFFFTHTKVRLVKAMVFPVVMYGCESSTVKKAEYGRSDAFELWCWKRLLRVPWTAQRSNQSMLKEISPGCSWRTDAEAETPVLWPPREKSWLIGKDPDAGRDRGQEEKGTTEDEMAGWHHQLEWCKFEWTLGVGDGQGGLVCCNSWGCKESDTSEQLNWTELKFLNKEQEYFFQQKLTTLIRVSLKPQYFLLLPFLLVVFVHWVWVHVFRHTHVPLIFLSFCDPSVLILIPFLFFWCK